MTGTFLERFSGPIRVNSSRTRFFFTETETRKATIAKNYEPIQVEGGAHSYTSTERGRISRYELIRFFASVAQCAATGTSD